MVNQTGAARYWRITFLAQRGRYRHVWAKNYRDPGAGGRITFWIVDKHGNEGAPREIVVAAPADIVRLRPAALSRMYAELEVA